MGIAAGYPQLLHARSLRIEGSGQVSWRPVQRLTFSLPRNDASEWRHPEWCLEGRLAGYSGGTAQVFDLLPFYPLTSRGTLTLLRDG